MPLDPKQQPPYYTPGTTPTPPTESGDYTRLNVQYATVQTSGTTETTLYTYTLPANTLVNNGDELRIKFALTQSNIGTNNIIRFYIDNTSQYANASDSKNKIIINLVCTKISSSQLQLLITLIFDEGTGDTIGGEQTIQTASTLDFTNTIEIKFTGECDSPGQLQTYQMTIDKITN